MSVDRLLNYLLPAISSADFLSERGMGFSVHPTNISKPYQGCRMNLFFNHLASPVVYDATENEVPDVVDFASSLNSLWPEVNPVSSYNDFFHHVAVVPSCVENYGASSYGTHIKFVHQDLTLRCAFTNSIQSNRHLVKIAEALKPVDRYFDGNVVYPVFGNR